jgi:hypothetical protein
MGNELVITDRGSRTYRLPLSGDRDATAAVEQLLELSSRGIKIRTRALTTTLFARLVLSDLFLHGIGGAKYDQVTDQIARAFFGFAPPEFATVSATLRLPINRNAAIESHERSCGEQLRELRYHPERFAGVDGETDRAQSAAIESIVADKHRWVQAAKTPHNARERHAAIAAANQALQPFVAERRRQIKSRCGELQRRKRADAILQSREYSFCLYPREHFEKLLEDLPLQRGTANVSSAAKPTSCASNPHSIGSTCFAGARRLPLRQQTVALSNRRCLPRRSGTESPRRET